MERPHIVVVDDNLLNLKALRHVLEPEYSVSMHAHGESAVRYLRGHHADLVLLDIEMPGENGFEVIWRLKADSATRKIPVIFLTALTDREHEVTGLSLGAVDFISKLSAPESILARIRVHVDLERHRHRLEDMVKEKTAQVERLQSVILVGLSDLIECRDDATAGHTLRTTEYVGALCNSLKHKSAYADRLDAETTRNILRAAPLHDIGKVGIHDSILLKPGLLTPEEYAVMQQHTVLGAKVIQRAIMEQGEQSFLKTAHEIILCHHERWDGSGYPYGLRGEEIPLSARIMAVADVYDALVTDRPYKNSFTHEEASAIITEEKEKHFDPLLVDAFLDVSEDFRGIAELINGNAGNCGATGAEQASGTLSK